MADQKNALEACLAETMEATEWTREEALVRISDCRRRLGISYDDYRRMRMYRVAPENQASHYERILRQRSQDRKDKAECIATTMTETGWTEEETIEKIQTCRAELGISYRDYLDLQMYSFTPENQAARYEKLKAKREREKRDRKKCIAAVMAGLDCTREEAITKIEACHERLGVSYRDYRRLELWKLGRHDQRICYRRYLRRRRKERAARASCLSAAVAAMGWSEEEALEKIRACHKELGIPYSDYLELKLWEKEPEEQAALYAALQEKRAAEGPNAEEGEGDELADNAGLDSENDSVLDADAESTDDDDLD